MKVTSVRLSLALAAWVLVLVTHGVGAQKAAPEASRTTLEGIYTTDQAARGSKLYGMSCLGGCHNATSHQGPVFKQNWGGQRVAELFERIKDTMPDDNPGMLTARETADIVSYLFKANGMPAGKDELGTDKETLAKIRIEMPAPPVAPPFTR
jgi:S-disulfanyl-L-cysteine oxidoreductase SoxD